MAYPNNRNILWQNARRTSRVRALMARDATRDKFLQEQITELQRGRIETQRERATRPGRGACCGAGLTAGAGRFY